MACLEAPWADETILESEAVPISVPPNSSCIVRGSEVYRLLDRINNGRTPTSVYKARGLESNSLFVVKTYSSEEGVQSSVGEERFERERRIQEALKEGGSDHENILFMHEALTDRHYMIYPFIEGNTLDDLLERDLAFEEVVKVTFSTCLGLIYAHDRGVVHRDIKPANLILGNEGKLKIIDFDIGKCKTTGDLRKTKIAGTPLYEAPEIKLPGISSDQRVDVYSMGVMLYLMLSGEFPFDGNNPDELLENKMKMQYKVPDNTRIPDRFKPVLNKSLQVDRNNRYENIGQFMTDFAVALV